MIHAAGRVGGILANARQPADFLYDNLMLHATVLRSAWQHGVKKLLYLGSSCIYPRECPQPIREESLLTGPLEPTNDGYAIAKIAGVMACSAYRRQYGCQFISAMPTNLYGPGDNFHPEHSHVLPGLIRRFHAARKPNGDRRRHHLGNGHSRAASSCMWTIWRPPVCSCWRHYDDAAHTSTSAPARMSPFGNWPKRFATSCIPIAELEFDTSKPDGTPRKLLDVSADSVHWAGDIRCELDGGHP